MHIDYRLNVQYVFIFTVIRAELTRTANVQDIIFPDPSQTNSSSSVLIPKEFIIERSRVTGDPSNNQDSYEHCMSFAGVDPVPIVNAQYENLENILPVNFRGYG